MAWLLAADEHSRLLSDAAAAMAHAAALGVTVAALIIGKADGYEVTCTRPWDVYLAMPTPSIYAVGGLCPLLPSASRPTSTYFHVYPVGAGVLGGTASCTVRVWMSSPVLRGSHRLLSSTLQRCERRLISQRLPRVGVPWCTGVAPRALREVGAHGGAGWRRLGAVREAALVHPRMDLLLQELGPCCACLVVGHADAPAARVP
jgi:hypothetical protein